MTNLQDLRLSDILPPRIKNKEILAIAAALDPELQEITAAIAEATFMPRIMELPEDLIDLLAWQLHVDFYEPLGLDLDQKRALVQNSLLWHRHKGTKYALESILKILFFTDVAIQEWFEYCGEPYFFRIHGQGSSASNEQYQDLIRAVNELKNERSWLEGVEITRPEVSTNLYIHGYTFPPMTKSELKPYCPDVTFDTQLQVGAVAFPSATKTTLTPYLPALKFETDLTAAGFAWTATKTVLRNVTGDEMGAMLQTNDGALHRGQLLLDDEQTTALKLLEVSN